MPIKFCSEGYFLSGLRFFNEPEFSDSDPQLKVPPGGIVLRIFTSWKNPSTSAGFESANPDTTEPDYTFTRFWLLFVYFIILFIGVQVLDVVSAF